MNTKVVTVVQNYFGVTGSCMYPVQTFGICVGGAVELVILYLIHLILFKKMSKKVLESKGKASASSSPDNVSETTPLVSKKVSPTTSSLTLSFTALALLWLKGTTLPI